MERSWNWEVRDAGRRHAAGMVEARESRLDWVRTRQSAIAGAAAMVECCGFVGGVWKAERPGVCWFCQLDLSWVGVIYEVQGKDRRWRGARGVRGERSSWQLHCSRDDSLHELYNTEIQVRSLDGTP